MTDATDRRIRLPWRRWLGIAASVVVGWCLLAVALVLAVFSGSWM